MALPGAGWLGSLSREVLSLSREGLSLSREEVPRDDCLPFHENSERRFSSVPESGIPTIIPDKRVTWRWKLAKMVDGWTVVGKKGRSADWKEMWAKRRQGEAAVAWDDWAAQRRLCRDGCGRLRDR